MARTPSADARADAELAQFIERRASAAEKREPEPSSEELIVINHERRERHRREQLRLRWSSYHTHLARLHQDLASQHEALAERLLRSGG